MAKHIFLTGEIQVGKSTAIRKFLANTGKSADGFLSHIVEVDSAQPELGRELYLARFDTERGETDSRLAARVRFPNFEVYTDVFDGHGAELLRSAGARELIIMDELGRMEEDAEAFKAAVFARLDGGQPVLGVVKMVETPFLDAVRAHPNVEIITVTEQNRDDVPRLLEKLFG
ncbi:MAG: nucleoside-triphosphatase [Oscillospiraceae bacterium]|nr:nucleoside-triphosphatase [Oscillospiraceae bacterium]